MKSVNLFRAVYKYINSLEEKTFEKTCPDYKSNLSMHLIIVSVLTLAAFFAWRYLVFPSVLSLVLEGDMSDGTFRILEKIYLLPGLVYWLVYFASHVRMFAVPKEKFGYGLLSFAMFVLLGPYLFPILFALILLSIALKIAIFLLWIVTSIVSLFSDNTGKRKRFTLDNGDEVTERSGLFGEKSYHGRDGKSYETNDGGRTFTEK